MDTYKKRIADRMLARKLKSAGAVLTEGPQWCGKTTQNIRLAEIQPDLLLQGKSQD